MRHLNPKAIALLALLAALAGCGGSGSSTTGPTEVAAPTGRAESTTRSPALERQATKKKAAKLSDKQIEKKIRELAKSGKPIPADSWVAKQIVAALTGNGDSKNEMHGKSARVIAGALEHVTPHLKKGLGGSGSTGQGSGLSPGVERILEQIQE